MVPSPPSAITTSGLAETTSSPASAAAAPRRRSAVVAFGLAELMKNLTFITSDKAGRTIHSQAISRHSTCAPSGLGTSGIVRRQSENLASVVGDGDRVLEVSREAAVGGDDGPAVVQDLRPLAALRQADHRLVRNRHPGLQDKLGARLSEVRNLRILVDGAADAVSDPVADDAEAGVQGHFLDRVADVPEMDAGAGGLDAGFEAPLRGLDELQDLGVGHAERDCAGGVAGKAVAEDADVGLHEVAGHDHAVVVWDAVDDLVVEGDAEMARKVGDVAPARIRKEAGDRVVLAAVVDHEVVDLARRHPGRDGGGADVADLRGHPARGPHPVDLSLGLVVDFHDL